MRTISAFYVNGKGLETNTFNTIHLPTSELQKLQVLIISYDYDWNYQDGWWRSELTEVQENIGELKKLQVLNLSGNSLNKLPDSIGDLINLKELYLDCNSLKTLPNTISKLHNLEVLSLSDNPFSELPTKMKHLTNLKRLPLDNNKVESFSKFGAELVNLEELIIYPIFQHRSYPLRKNDLQEKNLLNYSLPTQFCFKELMRRGCRIILFS